MINRPLSREPLPTERPADSDLKAELLFFEGGDVLGEGSYWDAAAQPAGLTSSTAEVHSSDARWRRPPRGAHGAESACLRGDFAHWLVSPARGDHQVQVMQMVDVHLPTADGRELVLSRYTQPEPEHRMLLDQLHLALPGNRRRRSQTTRLPCARCLRVVETFGGRLQSNQQLSGVARVQLKRWAEHSSCMSNDPAERQASGRAAWDRTRTGGSVQSRRVVIVGGRFSRRLFRPATTACCHVPRGDLHHRAARRISERGLAYLRSRCRPPAERAARGHVIDLDRPGELWEWVEGAGVLHSDDEGRSGRARLPAAAGFPGVPDRPAAARRRALAPANSMEHVRDLAVAVTRPDGAYRVVTSGGRRLEADLLVLATGSPVPSLRPPFLPEHAGNPGSIANPLEPGCLEPSRPMRAMLVVGSGLTALDIVSALLRREHQPSSSSCPVRASAAPSARTSWVRQRPGAPATGGIRDPPVPAFLRDEPCASAPGRRRCAASCAAAAQRAALAKQLRRFAGRRLQALATAAHRGEEPLPAATARLVRRPPVPLPAHERRRREVGGEQRPACWIAAATLLAVHPSAPGRRDPGGNEGHAFGEPAVRHFDWVVNCTGSTPALPGGPTPF